MSISALDSRYSSRLGPVGNIVGEENFVYFMSVWAIAYAECTNSDTYIPPYTNREDLYRRVCNKEKATKHQLVALNQVLEEDYPDIVFHYGLTSEDIMHNARTTQVALLLKLIGDQLREVEQAIKEYERQVDYPILAHTHGQPATPVRIGPYLRAKFRRLNLVPPEFRLGGSNGQLTAWKLASGNADPLRVAQMWERKVKSQISDLDKISIITPNDKQGLLQIGPSNEATFLSGMAVLLKVRSLARALWDHCQRKILMASSSSKQAGSSAMPHKVNPIDFENAEGAFTNAYFILHNALEANSDSRGLRDLSNSIVNRQMVEGWVYFYLGLQSLLKGMSTSIYSNDRIIAELRENPECLTELLRYYMQEVENVADPYWELKRNPPKNFDETIKRMRKWEIL